MSTRIVFVPWVAPDGQVQCFPDEVLADFERVEFDEGWAHIVRDASWSSARLRSYPAHAISCVHHAAAASVPK